MQMNARVRRRAVPDDCECACRRLRQVDALRAVHRRALHEHRARRQLQPVDAVRAALRRHHARLEDRRPQLPRVPPGRRRPRASPAPNDHWHQHNANGGLCSQGRRGHRRRGLQAAGVRRPRRPQVLLIDIWMVHAWVVPGFECSWGVFSGECPELGGRIGGTAWEAPESTSRGAPDPAERNCSR